jgi:hypothetical protein
LPNRDHNRKYPIGYKESRKIFDPPIRLPQIIILELRAHLEPFMDFD